MEVIVGGRRNVVGRFEMIGERVGDDEGMVKVVEIVGDSIGSYV